MRVIDFMNMTSGGYHEKQIEYNMTGLLAEIKQHFPEDINPNFSDPKYKKIIENHPFAPLLTGTLAKELGIDKEVLTLELWRDLSNGYCPAKYLLEGSLLSNKVVETERGPMVKLNKNPTPIVAGEYRPDLQPKDKRIGTEFVFGLGQNTSNALTALAIADPSVEKKFADIAKDIFIKNIIPQMEIDGGIRKGKDGAEIDYTSGLLIACFQHIENRGTDTSGPEPFRHFHFDILNTAMGEEDGELYSVMNDLICQNKEVYTAIFQEHLKPALEQNFGLTFKPIYLDEDRDNEYLADSERNITSWDVDDKFLPQSLRTELGKRTKEMEEFARSQGHGGFLAMEIARKESREDKSELSPSELKAEWAKWYQRHGFSAEYMKAHQDFNQVKEVEPALPTGAELMSNFMRKHKDIAFTENQWKAHVTKQLLGLTTGEKAREYAEKIFNEEGVLILEPEKAEYYKDFIEGRITDPREYKQKQIRYGRDVRFTSKTILKMEEYVVESSKARIRETKFQLDKTKIFKAIMDFEKAQKPFKGKPFQFAKGQKEAAIAALTDKGSIINIAGRAGAGKSTLLKVVVQQYEKAGFEVIGTSTSDQATKELAKSTGMNAEKCCNTAELFIAFKAGSYKFKPNTVCIVDEAGMADTETFYKLVKASNEAGAKLILVGEKEQLQSVGYGGLFKAMNERFVTKAVTDINRQIDTKDREMVEDFACGRANKAIDYLHSKGNVVIKKTNEGRLKQIVKDYVTDPKAYTEKFIVAATNLDVDTINNAIRAELKSQGKLEGPEVKIEGKDGIRRDFMEGDRIIFTKKQKSDNAGTEREKISNSERGTVIGFTRLTNGKLNTIRVKLDNGEEHFLNLGKPLNIKHGYASTVHKSQGSTKDSVYYWVSPTLNNLHQAYVACSRHRETLKMYLSNDMVESTVNKLDGKPPTKGMVKTAQLIAKKENIELAPETLKSFKETREFLNKHTYKMGSNGEQVPTQENVLDSFKQIFMAMSQTAFKKTTFDYNLGKEEEYSKYHEVKSYLSNRLKKAMGMDNDNKPLSKPQAVPIAERKPEQAPQQSKEIPIPMHVLKRLQAQRAIAAGIHVVKDKVKEIFKPEPTPEPKQPKKPEKKLKLNKGRVM
ncbi:AAA family ATPase [Diaphorobacter aerolatus]|uniref:AAA family ATPase n=1 Tax=Diaphorobacter aerolatus TaxID=1288495 RepID=A0A7H0GJB4_9BURK|nr:AAA family ATPase [Diaphorobacter aerolatus]QNP48380.1 AAA family ATPase [Diaphorobacter aerolatus]